MDEVTMPTTAEGDIFTSPQEGRGLASQLGVDTTSERVREVGGFSLPNWGNHPMAWLALRELNERAG